MKLNRRFEQGEEFRQRQGRFDFATVALAVVDVAVAVKSALSGWWKKVRPKAQAVFVKVPRQMVLELDSIAQMPLM